MKLKAVAVYATGTVLGAFFSLVTLPVMAWFFSQEDVGRIALFQVVLSLAVVGLSLGLDQAYVRRFNEEQGGERLAKTCLVPGLVLLLVLVAVLACFGDRLSGLLFDLDSFALYGLAALTLLILYLERFLSVFLRMKEMPFAYSLTRIIPKALILGMVAAVYLFPAYKNFTYLVIAQVVGWGMAVAIMFYYLRPSLTRYFGAPVDKASISTLLSFGLPLVINGIAFWGLSFMDRIMVKAYSSLSELGVYALASTLAGIAILFQQIFSTIWHPMIYRWVAEGVSVDRIVEVSEGLQVFSFVLVCIVAMFAWCVPYFLPAGYGAIEYILMACLLPPLFIMIAEATGVGINISNATRFAPLVTLLALLINAGLNVWLIPAHGAAGAAAASAISFYAYVVFRTEASIRVWKYMPRLRFYFCALIVTAMACAQALAGTLLGSYSPVMWVFALVTCLIAYRHSLVASVLYIRKFD